MVNLVRLFNIANVALLRRTAMLGTTFKRPRDEICHAVTLFLDPNRPPKLVSPAEIYIVSNSCKLENHLNLEPVAISDHIDEYPGRD